MANEISITTSVSVSKGGASIPAVPRTKTITMAGNNLINATQDIGTSAELVTFGDVSGAPAQVEIYNMDDTNFIELGGDSGLTVFKLELYPGESTLFRPSSGTLYAKSDTAGVRISKKAMER
jgi:hypothetical protein